MTAAPPQAPSTATAREAQLRLFRKSVLKQAKLREVTRLMGATAGLDCLDLGSDNGVVSLLLRSRGGRWRSADLGEKSVTAIRDLVGPSVARIDGERLPFRDASLDVVVVLDLLEHVPGDRELLGEIARVLRPGGSAVLNVPHARRREPLRRLRDALGLTDAWHGHVRHGYTFEEVAERLPPELRPAESRTYARFFSEALDTALNAAYARAGGGGRPETEKGTVVTAGDLRRHAAGLRALSLAFPALRLWSALDALVPFVPGSLLLVRVEKVRVPSPPGPCAGIPLH